jgi:hypothetical protein
VIDKLIGEFVEYIFSDDGKRQIVHMDDTLYISIYEHGLSQLHNWPEGHLIAVSGKDRQRCDSRSSKFKGTNFSV